MNEKKRAEEIEKAIPLLANEKGHSDPRYLIAFALLRLSYQVDDIGEQLYRIADTIKAREGEGE